MYTVVLTVCLSGAPLSPLHCQMFLFPHEIFETKEQCWERTRVMAAKVQPLLKEKGFDVWPNASCQAAPTGGPQWGA